MKETNNITMNKEEAISYILNSLTEEERELLPYLNKDRVIYMVEEQLKGRGLECIVKTLPAELAY
jgi:hypothetical protein